LKPSKCRALGNTTKHPEGHKTPRRSNPRKCRSSGETKGLHVVQPVTVGSASSYLSGVGHLTIRPVEAMASPFRSSNMLEMPQRNRASSTARPFACPVGISGTRYVDIAHVLSEVELIDLSNLMSDYSFLICTQSVPNIDSQSLY
jgi:hypothetical protein